MTVHKSKGLSFDAVIVCDLDQAIWKTPDIMEWHENPCDLPNLAGMYASDYLDEVLPEYKEMRIESHKGQVNDALCLLYVAMTRAKHAMHLVIPCRENATRHHKKFDGLLLQSIEKAQKQESNSIIWTAEHSDSTWVDAFSEAPKEELFSSPTIVIQQPSNPFELGRGIAISSPSSLEGGGKTNINERFAGGTNEAFDRGTIVHRWLEDIEWLKELPTIQTLIETAPRGEAARFSEEGLLRIAQSVIHALQTNEIQQLLTKPEGELKVYCEQDFALRVDAGTQLGK